MRTTEFEWLYSNNTSGPEICIPSIIFPCFEESASTK